MKHVHDILSGFKTLKEYTEFMTLLAEKGTSGQEIARGMAKDDKSKQEKKQVVTKEVKKNANGSSSETHYDHIDPNIEEAPEASPPPAMPIPPGQQVKIGNKQVDQDKLTPQTVTIDISGEKDTLNMKPQIDKNPDKTL